MNAEARRLGLKDTVYRTPHGLDEPGAHSSARDVLKLAQIDMRRRFSERWPGGRGSRSPATASRRATRCWPPMRAWTASRPATPTRRAGTSRRAPIAMGCGSMRSCSAHPTRPTATATSRGCSTGASTATSSARLVRARAAFRQRGQRAGGRRDAGSPPRSIRASRCSERVVLPRRLERARAPRRAPRLRRAAQRRAACSAACRSWPTARAAGSPALVAWLRSHRAALTR